MLRRPFLASLLLLPMLAGCNTGLPTRPVRESEYNNMQTQNGGDVGRLGGADGLTLGIGNKTGRGSGGGGSAQADGGALGVNAYLWRGALDTLSFMPLASADPFGGVIITDWYQPPQANDERFKATAYILGRQLRADGIRLSLFRQTLQNGRWVDAAVSTATTGELEDKVLARARELREQSVARN